MTDLKRRKAEILELWRELQPDQKVEPRVRPYDYRGSRDTTDRIKITGTEGFTRAVLSRLKDLLQYDGNGRSVLEAVCYDKSEGTDRNDLVVYIIGVRQTKANHEYLAMSQKPTNVEPMRYSYIRDQESADVTITGRFVSFDKARSYVRELELKTTQEWREWVEGKPFPSSSRVAHLVKLPTKPSYIPRDPQEVYGDSWLGWDDFLKGGGESESETLRAIQQQMMVLTRELIELRTTEPPRHQTFSIDPNWKESPSHLKQEAAKILCVDPRTIHNYVKQGRLKETGHDQIETQSIIDLLKGK